MEYFIGVAVYLLPILIGAYRGHARMGLLALVSLSLGWTGLGWLGALGWALKGATAGEAGSDAAPLRQSGVRIHVQGETLSIHLGDLRNRRIHIKGLNTVNWRGNDYRMERLMDGLRGPIAVLEEDHDARTCHLTILAQDSSVPAATSVMQAGPLHIQGSFRIAEEIPETPLARARFDAWAG